MESDDDLEQFSPIEASSSPTLHRNKLKRLKKATTAIDEAVQIQTLEVENSNYHPEDSVEPNLESNLKLDRSASEDENDLEWDSGFDFDTSRTKKQLDFDSEEQKSGTEMKDQTEDLGTEILEKNRRSFDESERSEENKKKKNNKHEIDDEQKSHVTNNKRKLKERKEQLAQLRSESQRLLRETRDATFKPAPIVQKSISSVLEKIRLRKQVLSKKSAMLSKTSYIDDFFMDHKPESAIDEEMENNATESSTDLMNDLANSSAADKTANHLSNENMISPMGLTEESKSEESKQEFRPPVDDTQDLFSDSQTSDSDKEHQEETPKSPTEVVAPSLLAMNLKFDSVPPEDITDEENDKENSDPIHDRSVDMSSSPNGDPIKNFLDDEAEEDDDSDNDQLQFTDNDEDNGDLEELQNMIATGYEEKSIDSEMRNELHQKWLEQQDAAGTEKVLQKLKCGVKQMETVLLDENEDEDDDDDDNGDDNEMSENGDEGIDDEHLVQRNIVKTNLRKAKEMISQMFTDKNDTYVSSDDEVTESRQVDRSRFEKHREPTKQISLANEEQCRNVVIKKMNVAQNSREKVKRSSLLNMTLLGGSRNVSATKLSFLGCGSHRSIPSSKRSGSGKGRSFIFERDDSNSSGAISKPEESFDMMQRGHHLIKTGSAKYRSSQSQSASQIIKATVEVQSGPSLHEILRNSSRKSTEGKTVCQTEAVFSAFKLEKKTFRKDPSSVSLRNR